MGLTAEIINKSKKKDKRYTLSDGRGLLLEIHPTEKKSWIVRYFIKNKEHRKQIGTFPAVDIRQAREMAQRIQGQAQRGEIRIDPNPPEKLTFRKVAEEWLEFRIKPMSPGYYDKTKCRLAHFGAINNMELKDITPEHILNICREIENDKIDKNTKRIIKQGRPDTAHRIRGMASQIFAFAISSNIAKHNPAIELRGALKRHTQKHHATLIKEPDIKRLMQSLDRYPKKITRLALLFSAHTFCRPGEVRHAEWSEIDWQSQEWQIPPHKMKMRRVHIVPLSDQVMELLYELRAETNKDGAGKWLFPSERKNGRPMSENTVRVALRLLDYSNEEMTAHGFRAMASTTLNRHKYHSDYIERQLAHIEKNAVRDAYNHYDFIDERREMMQHWSNYIWELMTDSIKKGEELAELLKSDDEKRWDDDNLLTEEELYIKYSPPSEDEED